MPCFLRCLHCKEKYNDNLSVEIPRYVLEWLENHNKSFELLDKKNGKPLAIWRKDPDPRIKAELEKQKEDDLQCTT